MNPKKILEIKNLDLEYLLEIKKIHALKNINLNLFENEIIGIIGESASGKSTLAHAIISLLEKSAKITNGEILFENENLLNKKEKELMKIRGKKISIIFQDPFSSLNPTMKIGKQILEAIDINPSKQKVFSLLKDVGIQDADHRYLQYPHQMSGGMRQRVMIAIAIASNPKIIIADEPTTSLDTTYQLQIIDLLKNINKKYKSSIIFISHNLAIVSNIASKLYIMYRGKIIEKALVDDILEKAKHPYTKLLLNSLIEIDENKEAKLLTKTSFDKTSFDKTSFDNISNDFSKKKICLFFNRCPNKKDICKTTYPEDIIFENSQRVLCHLYKKTTKNSLNLKVKKNG